MGQHLSQFTSEKESEVVGREEGREVKTLRIGADTDDTSSYESAREVPFEEEKKRAGRGSSRRQKKSKTQSQVQHSNNSGYEKPLLKERRGSVPSVVPLSSTEDPPDALSTQNRLMSFISRKSSQLKSNLKRAKSATKLEPKKSDGVVNGDTSASSPLSSLKRTMSLSRLSRRWQGRPRPGQERSDSAGDGDRTAAAAAAAGQKIRTSQSHESLLVSPANVNSLDLSLPYVQIKPLSSNLFGQEHCFQVSTTSSTKFFACRSDQERQKWIQHLQRTVQPFQDQTRRTDRSLELWILEATNLPAKQRYFCEIYLDSTLYGRTSSKVNGTLLFWAEQFDMTNLPAFSKLIVKLFREGNRSKRKEVNIFIGQVEVPAEKINERQLTESKFPITSSVVGRIGKDASLRMKARYQRIEILPIAFYQPLLEYLKTEHRPLVMMLESTLLHVRQKEELARSLVCIMQKAGCAKEFLVNILVDEINKQENQQIFLRSNSIASKAIDVYMKLIGEKYLRDTLSDFINHVLSSQQSLEVDSMAVPNNVDLSHQKRHLLDSCQTVWFKIFNSQSSMPIELKLVFHELRRHVLFKTTGDEEVARQLISSCLFLRFLCPAILSPSLFGLTQVYPQDKDARNLTLIAKAIQGLANFSKFGGGKEDFMIFLNQFVEREASNLKLFLDQISTVDPGRVYPSEDVCVVDLGRELSVLHSLLIESSDILMEKATEDSRERLAILNRILQDITEAKTSQNTSHQSKTPRASTDNLRNGYNSSSSRSTPLAMEMRTPVDDSIDGSTPGSQASTPRFISNTSFMLTGGSTTPSLSSDTGGSFCDIPRTRNTMREMQDSDLYISMTSEKSLPALPPVTSASVLFGSRLLDRPPHASSPTSSSVNRLMFAAETNSNHDFSTDVMSMIDNVLTSMLSPKEIAPRGSHQPSSLPQKVSSSSSSSLSQPSALGTGTLGRQQPLAFSNPLFSYPPAPRPSQTPPIFPSAGTLPGESDRKHCPTGSANGDPSVRRGAVPPAFARNTSPSPSLGEGHSPQPTGFLYGCHSHENLPHRHQRGAANMSNSVHPPNRNSAALAVSDVEAYFASSSGGVMSRSMEFPLPPLQPPLGPDSLLKRNNTDSMIILPRSAPGLAGLDTPPESPTFCSVGFPVGRRNGQPQGTVRMGVRSMQRKLQESEKGKLEYELELRHLQQQLAEMRRMQDKEKAAAVAEADAAWHQKMRQIENNHHQLMIEKEQKINSLEQRLLSLDQQNECNEATIRDLQRQLLIQKPRTLAMTHNATLDGRQCSTH